MMKMKQYTLEHNSELIERKRLLASAKRLEKNKLDYFFNCLTYGRENEFFDQVYTIEKLELILIALKKLDLETVANITNVNYTISQIDSQLNDCLYANSR